MINFHTEEFSNSEKKVLLNYFTNVDKPVFGLVNLPDVVKGALFARYSRSNKSLRRLFLDEFYTSDLVEENQAGNRTDVGAKRAIKLYDRMIMQYGDDSVAQLGGAHIACEQVSNILAKIIERSRLAAYLEQSTRYVYYNQKIDGKYNYITNPEITSSSLGKSYEEYIDSLFDTYSTIAENLIPHLKEKYPKEDGQSDRAWENTLKAKACDIVRGLLPASTRTNLGIYATGQAYEYMIIKMFSSKNEEVLAYAKMMLEELRKMIPSFLTRVDIENRGTLWSKYLSKINQNMQSFTSDVDFKPLIPSNDTHEVYLSDWDNKALDKVVADALYEYSDTSMSNLEKYVESLTHEEKVDIFKIYFGDRKNRRHKPGRGTENVFYKFDIVSDYGAFRDLQRHRLLTIQWQKISHKNGYVVPEELNEYPELKSLFIKALENAAPIFNKIEQELGSEIAQYAVPFAYKIRYQINMNLREAFHLIELRTQKQGHPSYRKVCIEMANLIESKHPIFAESMKYIDYSFHELSREDSEKKIDKKLMSLT